MRVQQDSGRKLQVKEIGVSVAFGGKGKSTVAKMRTLFARDSSSTAITRAPAPHEECMLQATKMIRKSPAADPERSALPTTTTTSTSFDPTSKKMLASRAAIFAAAASSPLFDNPFASVIGYPINQVLQSAKLSASPITLSNATNSKSPDDMKSRIFIGNLNTNLLTKRQVHVIFSAYGEIKAISMHKGFAFVQYTDQMDAVNAVYGQDGRILSGQAIGK